VFTLAKFFDKSIGDIANHGSAVEQGQNVIPKGSTKAWNSIYFAISGSLSHLKNLGMPKGKIMVDFTATIKLFLTLLVNLVMRRFNI
jgi:hypothetical protein